MNRRAIASIALPLWLAAGIFAQEPKSGAPKSASPDPKTDVQNRADSLFEEARHLSDIRAKSAPAFRLKATFTFTDKGLENRQGTYTEVWLSDSQWRREIVGNDFHRIEVGTLNRLWRLDSPNFPKTAAHVSDVLNIFPSTSAFKFQSIQESTAGKSAGECAITKPDFSGNKQAFCFDKTSGALLQAMAPKPYSNKSEIRSCFYGRYHAFDAFWFPREMACFEDKNRDLEVQVVELSAEPSPELSQFTPPPGATELGRCSGILVVPVPTLRPEPHFQLGDTPLRKSSTFLSMIVDKQGRPQELKVEQSGGKAFDETALETVKNWRFKPATCNSEPMPEAIQLEFDIHAF